MYASFRKGSIVRIEEEVAGSVHSITNLFPSVRQLDCISIGSVELLRKSSKPAFQFNCLGKSKLFLHLHFTNRKHVAEKCSAEGVGKV